MSRRLAGLDRFLVALVGLALVALGVLAVLWERDLVSWLEPEIATPGLTTAAGAGWWPWAVGVAGIVLVVLALQWLTAHVSRSRVGWSNLPGSSGSGRLSTDLGAVANAAAGVLQETPGVSGSSGSARRERGRRTIVLTVAAESPADVPAVVEAVESMHRDLAKVLPDPSVAVRVHLEVDAPR